MAESAIATGYIALYPEMTGIQASMRKIFAAIGQDASDALGAGIQKGVAAGGAKIKSQLSNAFNGSAEGLGSAVNKELGKVRASTVADGIAAPVSNATEQAVERGASKGAKSGLVDGIKGAGPAMTAAVAALGLGAAVVGSMQSAIASSKGEAKMKASLALDPESAKKASEAAKNLFVNNYGESLGDVQATTTAVLSSMKDLRNGSSADIEEITKRALNMSAAFEVDTVRSTQVAGQLMTQFGISGTEAMDLLSSSMGKVPAAVRSDILDAADEYAPFFKSLGYDSTEMGNLLVKASEKGMYGIDKLGDSLKEFGIRSTDMTSASAAGYEAIGLSQEEMTAKLLAGGPTAESAFKQIVAGLKGIQDPTKQATASLALFGTPLEDLSVAEIPQFLDTLVNVPGALGDVGAAAIQLDKDLAENSGASWDSFTRNAQVAMAELAGPLVEEFQPMLQQGISWIKENKAEIGEWAHSMGTAFTSVIVPAISTALPWIKSMGDFLAENKDTITALMPAILTLAGVIGGLSVVGSVLGPIGSLAGMLWAAVPAFGAATVGASAFGISILPLILIGAAVFAVGYAIGTFLYNLNNDFEGTMHSVGQFAASFGNVLAGIGVVVANALIGILNLVPIALNGLSMGANLILSAVGIGAQIPMIPTIPFIPLPKMATGGDVMGATALIAGEEEPETIVNRGKMNALIDDILAGKVGSEAGGNLTIENHITIQKGAVDDDDVIAAKIAAATQASAGAYWMQRRA